MRRLGQTGLRGRPLRAVATAILVGSVLSLSGCDDPQIYGSVGVSSGYGGYGGYYGGYGGWGQPRMHTSISVGGRIR
ncbi:hypothetical protein R0135_04065 [Congregibacter variabilis]|uniref:Lipoprotein n=1 Tax=Congregibacter variabilis TaxID=3081200 RepID=A0ABZ0I499_9GAMM|nr:hypothetical protein R0135_04065 [Congregibacter sp. IMCC43200]